jgi:Protein of unknown function DUF111
VTATGTGAGTKVIPGLVNVVRVLVASEGAGPAGTTSDTVIEFRCQVDDMTGEHVALAMERILAVGALDVLAAPVLMKKGRPGHALTVIATPATAAAVESGNSASAPCYRVNRRCSRCGAKQSRPRRSSPLMAANGSSPKQKTSGLVSGPGRRDYFCKTSPKKA